MALLCTARALRALSCKVPCKIGSSTINITLHCRVHDESFPLLEMDREVGWKNAWYTRIATLKMHSEAEFQFLSQKSYFDEHLLNSFPWIFKAKNSLLIIGQKMEFLFQCVMMVIKLALKLTVWFLREDCSVLTSRIWCAFWMYREAQLPKKRQKCSHYCHFKHNDKTPPTILSSLHLNSRIE